MWVVFGMVVGMVVVVVVVVVIGPKTTNGNRNYHDRYTKTNTKRRLVLPDPKKKQTKKQS